MTLLSVFILLFSVFEKKWTDSIGLVFHWSILAVNGKQVLPPVFEMKMITEYFFLIFIMPIISMASSNDES